MVDKVPTLIEHVGVYATILLLTIATNFLLVYYLYKVHKCPGSIGDDIKKSVDDMNTQFTDSLNDILSSLEKLDSELSHISEMIKHNETTGKIQDVYHTLDKVKEDIIELKTIISMWLSRKGG